MPTGVSGEVFPSLVSMIMTVNKAASICNWHFRVCTNPLSQVFILALLAYGLFSLAGKI